MRILILDQCSRSKEHPDDATVYDTAAIDTSYQQNSGEGVHQLFEKDQGVGRAPICFPVFYL